MPKKLYESLFALVTAKPIFGVGDLAALGVPRDYAKARLHQLCKSKKIERIERGKYTKLDDPLAVAAMLTQPSYLSLWCAMSQRGLTDQIPFHLDVVTSRKRFRRQIDFKGSTIMFHSVRPCMMYGYEHISLEGGVRVPVARPEKIIIDAVYLNAIPVGELGMAIEAADTGRLEEYAGLSRNKRVIETVGRMIQCLRQTN